VHLDPKTWWYISRATGFVGWALLAASVLWGLFVTTKTLGRSAPPSWVLDLHRHLGGLAVAFVIVHLAVLPLDGYTHWGVGDLLVPMASAWHPVPIAFAHAGRVPPGSPSDAHQVSTWRRLSRAASDIL